MKEIKREKLFIGLFSCILIILGLFQIRLLDYSCFGVEESNYISVANGMLGRNYNIWNDGVNQTMSHGYSLFLLPVLGLMPSAGLAYKAAVMWNIMCLVFCYWCMIDLAGFYLKGMTLKKRSILAFLGCLYPSFLYYTQFNLPDIMVMLLFLLTLVSMHRLYTEDQDQWLILSALFPVLGMSLSRSMLAVVVSASIFVYRLAKKRGYSEQRILTYTGILAGGIALQEIFEIFIRKTFYGYEPGGWFSRFTAYWDKMQAVFKPNHYLELLYSAGGKLFYVGLASVLVILPAFFYIGYKIYKRTCSDLEKVLVFMSVLLLLLASMEGLSASSLDMIANDRGILTVLPVWIMLGLSRWHTDKDWMEAYLGWIFCFLLFTLGAGCIVRYSAQWSMDALRAPLLSLIYDAAEKNGNVIYLAAVILVLLVFVLLALLNTDIPKIPVQVKRTGKGISYGILLFMVLFYAGNSMINVIQPRQKTVSESLDLYRRLFNHMPEDTVYYFISSNERHNSHVRLQVSFPETEIIQRSIESLEEGYEKTLKDWEDIKSYTAPSKDDVYLVPVDTSEYSKFNREYIRVAESGSVALFLHEDSNLLAEAERVAKKVKREAEFNVRYEDESDEVSCTLAGGTYEVCLDVRLIKPGEDGEVGQIRVNDSAYGYMNYRTLTTEDFEDSSTITVKIPFSRQTTMYRLTFSLVLADGAKAEVKDAYYYQTSTNFTMGLDRASFMNSISKAVKACIKQSERRRIGIVTNFKTGDDSFLSDYIADKLAKMETTDLTIEELDENTDYDYLITCKDFAQFSAVWDRYQVVHKKGDYLLWTKAEKEYLDAAKRAGYESKTDGNRLSIAFLNEEEEDGEERETLLVTIPRGESRLFFDEDTVKTGTRIQLCQGEEILKEYQVTSRDERAEGCVVLPYENWMDQENISIFVNGRKQTLKKNNLEWIGVDSEVRDYGRDAGEEIKELLAMLRKAESSGCLTIVSAESTMPSDAELSWLRRQLPGYEVVAMTENELMEEKKDCYVMTYGNVFSYQNLLSRYTLTAKAGGYQLYAYTLGKTLERILEVGGNCYSNGKQIRISFLDVRENQSLPMLPQGNYLLTLSCEMISEDFGRYDEAYFEIVHERSEDEQKEYLEAFWENAEEQELEPESIEEPEEEVVLYEILGEKRIDVTNILRDSTVQINLRIPRAGVGSRMEVDVFGESEIAYQMLWIETR